MRWMMNSQSNHGFFRRILGYIGAPAVRWYFYARTGFCILKRGMSAVSRLA
jgi:hypothetical protein